MKRLSLSTNAQADLEEIARYVAAPEGFANPIYAHRLVVELRNKCRAIGRRPRLYRLRPELGEGMRQALHKRYLILFRERAAEVRIERIIHGARDVQKAVKSRP